MALQGPFFGKREPETPTRNPSSTLGGASSLGSAGSAAAMPFAPPTAAATGAPAASVGTQTSVPAAAPTEGGAKLTVGPNIKLKGVEITDCDTLLVEGTVEATMDARLMQIAGPGAFNGTAEVDIAEIHGMFDGNLTVRQKLMIYATGKVTGKVKYGKIVIEEGGQLSGEISFGTASSGASAGGSSSGASSSSAKSDKAATST